MELSSDHIPSWDYVLLDKGFRKGYHASHLRLALSAPAVAGFGYSNLHLVPYSSPSSSAPPPPPRSDEVMIFLSLVYLWIEIIPECGRTPKLFDQSEDRRHDCCR